MTINGNYRIERHVGSERASRYGGGWGKFACSKYQDTKRQLRTRFAYILFQLVQYLDSQIIKVAIVHEAFEHLIGGHCWSQSCGTGITTRLLHLSQYFLKPLFAANFAFLASSPPPRPPRWWWIRTRLKTPYKNKALKRRLKIVCSRESVHGYQPKANCKAAAKDSEKLIRNQEILQACSIVSVERRRKHCALG